MRFIGSWAAAVLLAVGSGLAVLLERVLPAEFGPISISNNATILATAYWLPVKPASRLVLRQRRRSKVKSGIDGWLHFGEGVFHAHAVLLASWFVALVVDRPVDWIPWLFAIALGYLLFARWPYFSYSPASVTIACLLGAILGGRRVSFGLGAFAVGMVIPVVALALVAMLLVVLAWRAFAALGPLANAVALWPALRRVFKKRTRSASLPERPPD